MANSVQAKLAELVPWSDSLGPSLPWHRQNIAHHTRTLTGSLAKPKSCIQSKLGSFRSKVLLAVILLGGLVVLINQQLQPTAINITSQTTLPVKASANDNCDHPIYRITGDGLRLFDAVKSRQSRSLSEAVAEYNRRYGMPPPPHFDKWYDFAVTRGTVLIDEFDTIYHNLLPFWALEPRTIRSRTREDLGYNNRLVGISIRKGQVGNLGEEGKDGFLSTSVHNMVASFAHLLPDMDLAFNVHDEPRVVVPHDDLNRMVTLGQEAQSHLLSSKQVLVNQFSPSSKEFHEDIPDMPTTRFHDLGMQETWLFGRLSCPLESPARQLSSDVSDSQDILADTLLGLVLNDTAHSDICQTPSLRYRLGLFDKPNACKFSPELTPVFSMSKLSSFQDIIYPSPWYYTDQTYFDQDKAVNWSEQTRQVYWRGATSGGFSDKGTWRYQLRQYLVDRLTHPHPNETQLLLSRKQLAPAQCALGWQDRWDLHETSIESNEMFNLKFSEVKQCSRADCNDEDDYFGTAQREQQSEAWKYRYLLDMDGNAYSGRFYAFLQSYATVLKLSFFREWHADTLFPWVHYVPLSLKTSGYAELLRFFEEEPEGQEVAKLIADSGRDWAQATLRHEDIEVYMFRLLLE